MAYQVVTVDGRKFRAVIPDWAIRGGTAKANIADGSEVDVGSLNGKPDARPASKIRKLILNERGNYKMVSEEIATTLCNPRNMRAIEIEKSDPDYVKAWEMAHGFTEGKRRNIQVRGEALTAEELGVSNFENEHNKIIAEAKRVGVTEIANEAPEEALEPVRVQERTAKRAYRVKGGK